MEKKTNILAPTADGVILHSAKILPGGIHVEIGSNGNYFMNKTYYNSSFGGNICNHGGNRNSIGIESTMEAGKDYTKTMRNLAKLVAKLCYDNDLAIDRIKQHWHFSGKDCPRTIRASGRWQEFLELVSLELFALNYLEGVTFTWTSLSPTILDNYGKIIDHPGGTPTVSYKVVVKVGSETREYTQSATLAEKATTFTDLDWIVPA